MCDSSSQSQGSTARPNGVVSAEGGNDQQVPNEGRQIENISPPAPNSNNSNNNFSTNGQSFLHGLLPASLVQQAHQQQRANSLFPLHGDNLGNYVMNSHNQPQRYLQQQAQPLPSMQNSITHSNQGNAYSAMSHNLTNNPTNHQQGAHQYQVPHQGHSHPHSHVHPHHHVQHHSHHGSHHHNHHQCDHHQFGMNINTNNHECGGTHSGPHLQLCHHGHVHEFPSQQSTHSMNMNQHPTHSMHVHMMNPSQNQLFCANHAHLMNFQQNSQALTQLSPPRTPVSWLNGSQSSTTPISNQTAIITTNHNNNFNIESCAWAPDSKTSSPTPSESSEDQLPTSPDADVMELPGGLDILWRELPTDCQKMMTPLDVPEAARLRGYFTIWELFLLKRTLSARYQGINKPAPGSTRSQRSLNKVSGGRVKKSKGSAKKSKRGSSKDKSRKSKRVPTATVTRSEENEDNANQPSEETPTTSRNDNSSSVQNCNAERSQEASNENSQTIDDLLQRSFEKIKQEIQRSTAPAVAAAVGVGGIVKEAMDALDAIPSTSTAQNTTGDNQDGSGNDTDATDDLAMNAWKDSGSPQLVINENANSSNAEAVSSGLDELANAADIINNSGSAEEGTCCQVLPAPMGGRFCGQLPSYRATTLVIKLLQIGDYYVRSFSNVNPNRLRVLFNTQRLTYECHLPLMQPPNTGPPSRRVLTIDIGFEQISMLKFGTDSLLMRVDGPPVLTAAAVNASQEDQMGEVEALGPHDQFLLQQIENKELNLSPIHNLYFLNERLVRLLESQFRSHPRFSVLLAADSSQLQQ